MIEEKQIKLLLHPDQLVEARIVTLTPKVADERIAAGWWGEDCLKQPLPADPIDRHWDWNAIQIEYEGRILQSGKVAVVTGHGDRLAVQGAMLISTEPIPSILEIGNGCLLLELLFAAPRNRPHLRKDEQSFLKGVGQNLVMWGVRLSFQRGFGGRLRLDASPDSLGWYERRGLQKLDIDPIVYEGVGYTPMELSPEAALLLLAKEDRGGVP